MQSDWRDKSPGHRQPLTLLGNGRGLFIKQFAVLVCLVPIAVLEADMANLSYHYV